MPDIVREASEVERLQWALIENIQRADLAPLEEAEAFRQLADDFGLTQEEIAIRVGKSRAAVTNMLRLLRLPGSVKEALAEGKISEGHARALLALPSPSSMAQVLKTILLKGVSVRQTKALQDGFPLAVSAGSESALPPCCSVPRSLTGTPLQGAPDVFADSGPVSA